MFIAQLILVLALLLGGVTACGDAGDIEDTVEDDSSDAIDTDTGGLPTTETTDGTEATTTPVQLKKVGMGCDSDSECESGVCVVPSDEVPLTRERGGEKICTQQCDPGNEDNIPPVLSCAQSKDGAYLLAPRCLQNDFCRDRAYCAEVTTGECILPQRLSWWLDLSFPLGYEDAELSLYRVDQGRQRKYDPDCTFPVIAAGNCPEGEKVVESKGNIVFPVDTQFASGFQAVLRKEGAKPLYLCGITQTGVPVVWGVEADASNPGNPLAGSPALAQTVRLTLQVDGSPDHPAVSTGRVSSFWPVFFAGDPQNPELAYCYADEVREPGKAFETPGGWFDVHIQRWLAVYIRQWLDAHILRR